MVERVGGYISKLVFNNGNSIDLNKDDIVIFVGPNNAGKSQSLKDIFNLSMSKDKSVVIVDAIANKQSSGLENLLNTISNGRYEYGYVRYGVLEKDYIITDSTERSFLNEKVFGDLTQLFIANLNTSARLEICKPPQNITRNGIKKHPIHYAAFDRKYRIWLSENFKKAFGKDLIPNTQYGATIPLCIGESVKLNSSDFQDDQEHLEAYADVLSTYDQVQNQGDGIKSFTGILLYLMLDYFCVYLLDEPESFLHPPQAQIMGEIIGETLKEDQQAFISTHSEEIIKGLMETCPERIKIVRITREGNTNNFSILNNEDFNLFWKDPLLKHSNIMSSLFHKSVVLCESDSDCKMYSIIESHLKQSQGKFSETLFIHCGGKHRMAKVISALRSLNVDVKLIPDFDVLNDELTFKNITQAFGINWESISKNYNIIASNLHSPKEKINRQEAKTTINNILDSKSTKNLNKQEIESIKDSIKTISKWDSIKRSGKSAIPSGDSTVAFREIDTLLKENGIYIVPVGELECFIKEVGGHGPEWTNNVLETYPNFDDEVYNDIKEFIASLDL